MNINLYQNKSELYEHIYFISNFIKINKDIISTYFKTKLYENKSGHYCNLGNDWSHWTLTGSHIYPLLAWSTLLK